MTAAPPTLDQLLPKSYWARLPVFDRKRWWRYRFGDVLLANPPYSIKQWDRDAFSADPWGRNLYGTPPQGRADYPFWQHILASMANSRRQKGTGQYIGA